MLDIDDLNDGLVRCWGRGDYGQFGHGNTEHIGDDETPDAAPPLSLGAKALQVSIGSAHACALLVGRDVRCWGSGLDGRLGYSNKIDIGDDEPPDMVGYVNIGGIALDVAAGGHHTCAMLSGGVVRCWGRGDVGRLSYRLRRLGGCRRRRGAGLRRTEQLRQQGRPDQRRGRPCLRNAGERQDSMLGLQQRGQLGYGHTNNIGDDETATSVSPVDLDGPAVQVSAGGVHTCALLADGSVRCWGDNAYGQLGLGHTKNIGDDELPSSQPPANLEGRAIQVVAAPPQGYHTRTLLEDGEVLCWERGNSGELGYEDSQWVGNDELPSSKSPVKVGGTALGMEPPRRPDLRPPRGGSIRCWGRGEFGSLGYGNTGGGVCLDGMNYACAANLICCVGDGPGEMPPPAVTLQ